MKVKVSELIGAALDWAVDVANGVFWSDNGYFCREGSPTNFSAKSPAYSTDWSFGGSIIEKGRITLDFYCNPDRSRAALGYAEYDDEGEYIEGSDHEETGPTPLVAAMRCYVSFKIGEEIEVPDDLVKAPE